jgi:serine/threonine-protein kinase
MDTKQLVNADNASTKGCDFCLPCEKAGLATCDNCGRELADPRVGKVIADKYRIDARLAAGGIGRVYRATHLTLGEPVAMKFLLGHWSSSWELRERFRREAIALARLRHPAIVSVIDFGEDHGDLFMAMELVSGSPLSECIRGLGLLRLGPIFDQILEVLEIAHESGIVHRDMKPDNVMVMAGDRADRVKVLDFGLAQLSIKGEGKGPDVTEAGSIRGTPWYMSPEQAKGEVVDPKTDVYAVGVMLYEALVGKLPFEAADSVGAMTQHMFVPPAPFAEKNPDVKVSPGVEAVVMRALTKDRAARPSARELREQLAAALSGTDAISLLERAADERAKAASEDRSDRALTMVRGRTGRALSELPNAKVLLVGFPEAKGDDLKTMLAVNGVASRVSAKLPDAADKAVRCVVLASEPGIKETLARARSLFGASAERGKGTPVLVAEHPDLDSLTPLVTQGASDVTLASATAAEVFRKVRRLLLLTATALVVVVACAAPAFAREPVPDTYTAVAGDTCAAIATRFYGDSARVDLIHKANPGWGAPPHNLTAGQVIHLLPLPADGAKGPDATLSRVRNRVEVEAPEVRRGKPNDPLFRGNRVSTQEQSSAEVTFRDETQLRLAERTLIVILGSIKAAAKKLTAEDTVLVNGAVRARLSALAGGGAASTSPDKVSTIQTDGARVQVRGESLVTVDAQKTTRLASYKGTSALTAQNKTVDVRELHGSKAETGKAPTPPKPLPGAPRFLTAPSPVVLAAGAALGDVTGTLAPGAAPAGSDPVARYHVELARDADFGDVVSDVTLIPPRPLEQGAFTLPEVPPGTYFLRASAIDVDAFEGPFASAVPASVLVGVDAPKDAPQVVLADPTRQLVVPMLPREAPARVPSTPTETQGHLFALDASAGPVFANDGVSQVGLGVRVAASYGRMVGPGELSLGLGFGYENYGQKTSSGVGIEGLPLGAGNATVTSLYARGVVVPLRYTLGARATTLRPFLQARPELLLEEGTFHSDVLGVTRTTHLDARIFGLSLGAGAEFGAGPGAFFLEAGYRVTAVIDRGVASEPLSGIVTSLGYRLQLQP